MKEINATRAARALNGPFRCDLIDLAGMEEEFVAGYFAIRIRVSGLPNERKKQAFVFAFSQMCREIGAAYNSNDPDNVLISGDQITVNLCRLPPEDDEEYKTLLDAAMAAMDKLEMQFENNPGCPDEWLADAERASGSHPQN